MLLVICLVTITQCFEPFVRSEDCRKGLWLPFTEYNDGAYEKYRSIYESYVHVEVKGKALDSAAVRILQVLNCASESRANRSLGSSEVWAPYLGKAVDTS